MIEQINDISMYYEDQGSGPTLVFIHGLGENSHSWHNQISFFHKSFRTLTMDLRGHSQSGDGTHSITIAQFAKDIIALLDKLQVKQAHFVGHSMGGLICQELAVTAPERMLSMILSDSAGYYPPPFSTVTLEKWLKRIDTCPMHFLAEETVRVACHPSARAEIKSEMLDVFAQIRQGPYREATIATITADYRPFHKLMKIPTLILVGSDDQVTPYHYATLLNQSIQNSKLQIIPNSGHMTKYENPSAYNLALTEFLLAYEFDAALKLLNQTNSTAK